LCDDPPSVGDYTTAGITADFGLRAGPLRLGPDSASAPQFGPGCYPWGPPAIGPEQINARNAALLREENEVIARYAAHQRGHRARDAAEARAAQEERSRRRAGGR
jgi:hypothetical protein